MELILWRHAEAEDGDPDLARKLTGKGDKQARRMAEWLHAHLPDSARILVSPAVRAQRTAQPLLDLGRRKSRTVERLAPGASATDVLEAADWPQARQPTVIVGHQPTLGWVVGALLGTEAGNWSIKKGAVWWLQSRVRDGESQVVLRAVINPDLL